MEHKQLQITGADLLAVAVFIVATLVRAFLEYMTAPGEMADYAWTTNFACIAAGWLSVRSRVGQVGTKMDKVEERTNGGMDQRIAEVVRKTMAEVKALDPTVVVAVPPIVPAAPNGAPTEEKK